MSMAELITTQHGGGIPVKHFLPLNAVSFSDTNLAIVGGGAPFTKMISDSHCTPIGLGVTCEAYQVADTEGDDFVQHTEEIIEKTVIPDEIWDTFIENISYGSRSSPAHKARTTKKANRLLSSTKTTRRRRIKRSNSS